MNIDQPIHDRWAELKWEGITIDEREYLMLWWLVMEVYNGTYDQYFHNDTGDGFEDARKMAEKIGNYDLLENMDQAMALLDKYGGYKSNSEERHEVMKRFWEIPMDEQEKEIRKISDPIQDYGHVYLDEAAEYVLTKLRKDDII